MSDPLPAHPAVPAAVPGPRPPDASGEAGPRRPAITGSASTDAGSPPSSPPRVPVDPERDGEGVDPEAGTARRRRRGSRGGRNRSRQARDETTPSIETDTSPPGRRRRPAVAGSGETLPTEGEAVAQGQGGPVGRPAPRAGRPSAGPLPDGPVTPPTRLHAAGPPAEAAAPVPAGPEVLPGFPATSATNGQALPRPKIGDSRPAPAIGANGNGRAPSAPGPDVAGANVAAAPGPAPARKSRHGAANRDAAARDVAKADTTGEAGSKRRHRSRGKSERPTSDRAPVESIIAYDPGEIDDETLDRRRGRERKGRPVGRYLMVVRVQPNATQIAVLEGRSLIEHYVSRPSDDANQIDGNIYLGRVQNVLPGMEAAFVDIGTPKNAVLYRGDVRYDKDEVDGPTGDGGKPTRGRIPGPARDARIEQLLKPGQNVLCQVTKNPIGAKGARLAQEVSLPGRFVVFIPGSDTYGISKRLPDDERKRLRRILDEIRPEGHGLIVRTAAEGATADELRRDVARLRQQWDRIDELAQASRTPRLLYREPGMAVRVIREEFNRDYRGVIIDDRELFEEVRDYVASISPELADRVEFAGDSDDPLPAFERYHVHEQVHKALDRKVWLPSGGSLIIERTEALTVIDVNTGKNVGKSNLEETVFRNNLEAAEEIARQLRLRDIGGIIVIDFIDMEIVANRGQVVRTFRDALARDKTRTQVFDISELGLVEMTRKRISEGLVESFSTTCPTCAGRGFVLDESLL